jgi:hypothetical protein
MTSTPTDDRAESFPPILPTRWIHWLLLGCILLTGTLLRLERLTHDGYWLDEFWSIYLSTGRGDALFDAPSGVLYDPAPASNFVNAPPWWRVWSGMHSAVHPPLYHIVLRWWIDGFSDSETSTRLLSTVFSLASIIIHFDIVRRTSGPWQALAPAMLMSVCLWPVHYSQVTRSYTMLVFLGLLAAWCITRIERDGPTLWRLILLFIATWTMAMTHYFAAGALAGMGLYVLIRLRGSARAKTAGAMIGAILLMAITWGPSFIAARGHLQSDGDYLQDPNGGLLASIHRVFQAPAILVLSQMTVEKPVLVFLVNILYLALALFALVIPVLNFRRQPLALFWWLWVMGSLWFVAVFDVARQTDMLVFVRYIFLATPGILCLLVMPPPMLQKSRRRGCFSGALLIFITTWALAADFHHDSPAQLARLRDWRALARLIDQTAGPRDTLVFNPSDQFFPAFWYMSYRDYVPDSQRPVMFLTTPADASAQQALRAKGKAWFIGFNPDDEARQLLPGWNVQSIQSIDKTGGLGILIPPGDSTQNAPGR